MIIDITPMLDRLRAVHGTITIAVIDKPMSIRFAEALTPTTQQYHQSVNDHAGRNPLQFNQLPDGRTAVVTHGTSENLQSFLYMEGVPVEAWIQLSEYDDYYEEAAYVANFGGRHVRVQTGMLDELFGYIATQSSRIGDTLDANEDIQLKSTGRFETLYERIAAPARVQ
jgi:hypothetical protein